MTSAPMRDRPGGPAWKARPGPEVTAGDAGHGELRTDANGTQWWFDAGRGWQPVVVHPARPSAGPRPELEAG